VTYDLAFTEALLFGERICATCHAKKPKTTDYFDRDATQDCGLHRDCKVCRRARQRGRTDGPKRSATQRERYQNDPVYREKRRAASRKVKT